MRFRGYHHVQCYVRERLHRKLFLWFGLAIMMSGVTLAATARLFGIAPTWSAEMARLRRFAGDRFAHAWHDPAELDNLSQAIARDMDIGVRVTDTRGVDLVVASMPERCRRHLDVAIRDDSGAPLGTVRACVDRHAPSPGWRGPLALLCAGFVLWGIAGKVSRRISRPISELTRVARAIGEGNLGSRARLRHGMGGEVGELTEAVNEMASRLERQLREQRELLAAVSHELRTPLTRIRLVLELARDGADVPRSLDEIDREVVEIDALVGDLLANARVEFSALALRSLDARAMAERAVSRASLPTGALAVEGDPGVLFADATLLARALAALLDNAAKHGGTRVALRVRGEDDRVRFEVTDDGAGFAPGDEERVFEPFYRGGDRAQSEPRGVGLGLSLVRRIAEAHGGTASAQNVASGGACVGITLPRRPEGASPKALTEGRADVSRG